MAAVFLPPSSVNLGHAFQGRITDAGTAPETVTEPAAKVLAAQLPVRRRRIGKTRKMTARPAIEAKHEPLLAHGLGRRGAASQGRTGGIARIITARCIVHGAVLPRHKRRDTAAAFRMCVRSRDETMISAPHAYVGASQPTLRLAKRPLAQRSRAPEHSKESPHWESEAKVKAVAFIGLTAEMIGAGKDGRAGQPLQASPPTRE